MKSALIVEEEKNQRNKLKKTIVTMKEPFKYVVSHSQPILHSPLPLSLLWANSSFWLTSLPPTLAYVIFEQKGKFGTHLLKN